MSRLNNYYFVEDQCGFFYNYCLVGNKDFWLHISSCDKNAPDGTVLYADRKYRSVRPDIDATLMDYIFDTIEWLGYSIDGEAILGMQTKEQVRNEKVCALKEYVAGFGKKWKNVPEYAQYWIEQKTGNPPHVFEEDNCWPDYTFQQVRVASDVGWDFHKILVEQQLNFYKEQDENELRDKN